MIDALPRGATRLVLVRHCEADVAPGTICGRMDPLLSAAGRAHAERLADHLRTTDVGAVYASPARRALETARAVAARHAASVRVEDGLAEVSFGELEGMTWREAQASHPEVCATWLARPQDVAFPRGEAYRDVAARAMRAVNEIMARHPDTTVVAVAHAGVNRVILASAIGATPEVAFRIDQPHGAISILDRYAGASFVLKLVNGGPRPVAS